MSGERPWTAKRCTRLLRPLTTAVSSLKESNVKRHQDHRSASAHNEEQETRGKLHEVKDSNGQREQNGEAFDWSPYRPRKRVKRTYRAGGNSSSFPSGSEPSKGKSTGPDDIPGEIPVTTPLLTKGWPAKSYKSISGLEDWYHDKRELGSEMSSAVQQRITSSNIRSVPKVSLIRSFQAIMHETWENGVHEKNSSRSSSSTPAGAKSLFQLCLQNVPAHIADEQAWREQQDRDDKSDALADVYDFLESIGTGLDKGWQHLRRVVRAHGVSLVTRAIGYNLLSLEETKSVLAVCQEYDALDEAQRLFRTWALNPAVYRNGSKSLEEFFILHVSFKSNLKPCHPLPSAFEFRLFDEMIRNERLPLEWLTAPLFRRAWYSAIRSLAVLREDFREAESFILAVLLLASGTLFARKGDVLTPDQQFVSSGTKLRAPVLLKHSRPDNQNSAIVRKAFTNTISSLCTIFSAIHLVQFDSGTLDIPVRHNIQKLLREAVTSFEEAPVLEDTDEYKDVLVNRLLICGADLILACYELDQAEKSTMTALDVKISHLISVSRTYDSLGTYETASGYILTQLMRSITHCYGRANGNTGFAFIKTVVYHMLDYKNDAADNTAHARIAFMRKFALDSAMNFTEAAGSTEHEKLLLTAEELVRELRCVEKNLGREHEDWRASHSSFGTLQWDEGLCEWVTATPVTTTKAQSRIHTGSLSFHPFSPTRNQQYPGSEIQRAVGSGDIRSPEGRAGSGSSDGTIGLSAGTWQGPCSPIKNREHCNFEDSGVFDSEPTPDFLTPLVHRKTRAVLHREPKDPAYDELISQDDDELLENEQDTLDALRLNSSSQHSAKDTPRKKPRKRARHAELESLDLTSDELG